MIEPTCKERGHQCEMLRAPGHDDPFGFAYRCRFCPHHRIPPGGVSRLLRRAGITGHGSRFVRSGHVRPGRRDDTAAMTAPTFICSLCGCQIDGGVMWISGDGKYLACADCVDTIMDRWARHKDTERYPADDDCGIRC